VRIHRATIVKMDRVREPEPYFHGAYNVVLRDGTKLTLSRGQYQCTSLRTSRCYWSQEGRASASFHPSVCVYSGLEGSAQSDVRP
jgi:LytTr DNA-binding domain